LEHAGGPVNGTATGWLRRLPPKAPVRLRLFCFPSAGAGASMFGAWWHGMPSGVEICAVQLPGREDRRSDPPLRRLPAAVQHLLASLEPFQERPFAFFGHSMGALLAFETARALRSAGSRFPVHLFCSACHAPEDVRAREPAYALPHDKFMEHIRRLGGVPEQILREPDLMRLFIPILRADLELHQTYEYRQQPPFEFPITAFAGLHDTEVPPRALDAWRHHTTGSFERLDFPAGHFFIQFARQSFLQALSAILQRVMDDPTT
jgi:medium-chain acyl-[acyl-carrier-protein] hydrolase